MSINRWFGTARMVAVGALLVTLTACASVSWECKVGGKVNQQAQRGGLAGASGGATIAAEVSGSVSATSSAAAFARWTGVASQLDAGDITMDTSGSSVAWPGAGQVALTLVSRADGGAVAAQSFGWVRVGSRIRFSDAAAVNAWLASTGGDESTHRVDYAFQNLTMPAAAGANLIAVDVFHGDTAQATAAATVAWDGPHCTPTREFQCQEP